MTGPEHYREAERLLEISTADNPVTAAEALVHATLALAAATALCQPDERGYIAADLYQPWHRAVAS